MKTLCLLALLACSPRVDHAATAGLVCEIMGEAFCSRYDVCWPDRPFADPGCMSGWMTICCGEKQTCNIWATRTTVWAEDCAADISVVACDWYFDPAATYPETCRL